VSACRDGGGWFCNDNEDTVEPESPLSRSGSEGCCTGDTGGSCCIEALFSGCRGSNGRTAALAIAEVLKIRYRSHVLKVGNRG
jgi:hypothetical protein